MQEHLDLKDFLLSPKMSDKVTTWYYYEGWRLCESQWAGSTFMLSLFMVNLCKKEAASETGQEILKTMYWKAASSDAYYKALADGKKRKSKNWEKLYA